MASVYRLALGTYFGTRNSVMLRRDNAYSDRVFQTGSPHNIPAGSQANLDELMEFYRKQNREAQEKRERKAKAIYEGRESELSRWPDESKVKPTIVPASNTQ